MVIDHTQIQEYESFINKIPGVLSSKIIVNDQGNIVELHILAGAGRNPKQISRDVQSALIARYGIPLDHKVISIAQIQDESSICRSNSRLALKNIQLSMEDSQIEAKVVLMKDDKLFEGASRGLNFTQGRLRTLAEATINAIQQFLGSEYAFSVTGIQQTIISGKPVCVVAVSHVTEQGENFLVGSSPVGNDDNKAVVKAVLDALNRRISKFG